MQIVGKRVVREMVVAGIYCVVSFGALIAMGVEEDRVLANALTFYLGLWLSRVVVLSLVNFFLGRSLRRHDLLSQQCDPLSFSCLGAISRIQVSLSILSVAIITVGLGVSLAVGLVSPLFNLGDVSAFDFNYGFWLGLPSALAISALSILYAKWSSALSRDPSGSSAKAMTLVHRLLDGWNV